MKIRNVFFVSILMLVGTTVFANSNTTKFNNSDLTSISNEIELTIDLGDLTTKSQKEINQEISSFINETLKSVDDELQCKVIVTGSVNDGVDSVEISVEVSGSCSEIKEKGTENATIILDAVKDDALRN